MPTSPRLIPPPEPPPTAEITPLPSIKIVVPSTLTPPNTLVDAVGSVYGLLPPAMVTLAVPLSTVTVAPLTKLMLVKFPRLLVFSYTEIESRPPVMVATLSLTLTLGPTKFRVVAEPRAVSFSLTITPEPEPPPLVAPAKLRTSLPVESS